jgi:two-component system, NtrC family, response regulator HydG
MAKLLLAEDHTSTRTTMRGLLSAAGHEIDVAASGVEAVLLLKQKTYDLLITDLIMPEGTGFEVIQHLRKRKMMIPVLICSGYINEKGADKSLEGFRFSALSKPFRPEALLAAVKTLLAPPAPPK